MEGIRRALVLGLMLVLIAGTAIEPAPSVGPHAHTTDFLYGLGRVMVLKSRYVCCKANIIIS